MQCFRILATTLIFGATVVCQVTEPSALSAAINGPSALAVYKNYLFVLEAVPARLLRIDLQHGTLRVMAGNGKRCCRRDGVKGTQSILDGPFSLAVDSQGNVFIGEVTGTVRRLDAGTGIITTIVGDGIAGDTQEGAQAPSAHFWSVDSLAIDSKDNLYIADNHQEKIFKVDRQTNIVTTFAGNGKHGFSGDGQLATHGSFRFLGITFDSSDDLVIADYENCRIRFIDGGTSLLKTVAVVAPVAADGTCANPSTAPGPYPSDPATDADNNIYFVEGAFDVVVKISASTGEMSTFAGQTQMGGFSGDGGPADAAKLANPSGLAFDEAGNLYIAEYVNNRIRKVDGKTHRISTVAGNGLPHRIDIEL